MNVQLLLLLALVGPFCAFTHAGTTWKPTATGNAFTEAEADATTDSTGVSKELIIVTVAPTTVLVAAPEIITEAFTKATSPAITVNTKEQIVETEAPTAVGPTEAQKPVTTAAPAVEREAPTTVGHTEAQKPVTTAAPAVETEAPAPTKAEGVVPVVMTAAEEMTNEEVVINDPDEGLSSGQVVGIVIGALLAVLIVTAVVIAAVRRMGKYSSGKNKKPAKKDSVMVSPLRKKSAKQPERPKFWKF